MCIRDRVCTAPGGELIEAEPFFPSSLAAAALSPAHIEAKVQYSAAAAAHTITLRTNTTAPYVFVSSTAPGEFSDNSFVLLPGTPRILTFTAAAGRGEGEAPHDPDAFRKTLAVYSINNKAPLRP